MKRRIQFSLICLVAALFLGQLAAAESPFAVDAWNTTDGLRQSSVLAIAQTRDGYLWLGTLNGLLRFDGNSFTPFNVNNTPGLPSNVVIFLFEDSRTNLWVGTGNAGLCSIRNGVVKNYDTSGAGKKITSAFEDASGTVWFGAADGSCLCWKDGKLDVNPTNITTQFSLQFFYRSTHQQISGKNGVTWRLQSGHVEKMRGDRLEQNCGPNPWGYSPVPAPFQTAGGIVGGVIIDANVTAVAEDRDGNLVVGTKSSGVFWFNATNGWSQISAANGLSPYKVASLCFDRENNLWVGTDGGGLNRIQGKLFSAPAGLSGVAQSIAEDGQEGLWVAFNGGGLDYSLTNAVQNFGIGVYSNAWAVFVDDHQRVWAGTRGEGLFQFVSGSFQPVSEAKLIGLQIFALFQTQDGNIWAGGQGALGCYNGRDWKFFSTADGLPPNPIRALAGDAGTNLWIGTDGGGLFILRDGKIFSTNAPVSDISCLLVDRDDVLWVGTSGHGLARFTQGRWTRYAARDGLAGDDIGYLIEDDFTNLWLGSYEGLMRVEKKSLTDFAPDSGKKISCRMFLTRECSAGAQPAASRARDGRLFFPTTEGLVSVDPVNLPLDTNPPPVVIESVLVDGVGQDEDSPGSALAGGVTLAPENEQLEIHFTALNFSAPKGAQFGTRFKYQLEGRDKKPTDAGGERVAHFSKLAPGDYVFRVMACNEDGVWNETGATIAITVEPPFWRKPWFIAVCVLFFIGVLAGTIYLISTAKLKRQLRVLHQKELIERERARIARDLHDQLGANLTQVTLLGEMAEVDKHLPEEIAQHAQQICVTARETTHALDEIVWAVNPSNDTLEGLANYACKYAQDYFALAGIRFRVELPPNLPPAPIPPEVRHNVFLAFKEAVNNVVKHAQATEARVGLKLEPDKFILNITDNGRGLGDVSGKSLRNGMKNMRKRLADAGGEFDIAPGAGGGTVVQLKVPVVQK